MSRALQILLALVATRSAEAASDTAQTAAEVEVSTQSIPTGEAITRFSENPQVIAADGLGPWTRSRAVSL